MAADYTVTSQQQTQELTPQGRFRDVMEITFDVPAAGANGRVRIPVETYTAEVVRDAIERQVAEMLKVAQL